MFLVPLNYPIGQAKMGGGGGGEVPLESHGKCNKAKDEGSDGLHCQMGWVGNRRRTLLGRPTGLGRQVLRGNGRRAGALCTEHVGGDGRRVMTAMPLLLLLLVVLMLLLLLLLLLVLLMLLLLSGFGSGEACFAGADVDTLGRFLTTYGPPVAGSRYQFAGGSPRQSPRVVVV